MSRNPKVDAELKAYLASEVPVYRERLDTLTEAHQAQPWYRRAWAWIMDAHKLLTVFTAVCAATIAGHAYIAGLITKDNLETSVTTAVAKAMLDTRGDVADLKDHTAGIVDWRKSTQEAIVRHDEHIRILEKQEDQLQGRVDKYLSRR